MSQSQLTPRAHPAHTLGGTRSAALRRAHPRPLEDAPQGGGRVPRLGLAREVDGRGGGMRPEGGGRAVVQPVRHVVREA
eukprot:scaffold353_cov66-Phaeocystis_antarctica.AAC.4